MLNIFVLVLLGAISTATQITWEEGVIEFSPENAENIFSGEIKSYFLLLAGASFGDRGVKVGSIKTLAAENKGEMLFVTIDTNKDGHKGILQFFGFREDDLPAMRIVQLGENPRKDPVKYSPLTTGISEDSMRAFIKSYKAGELKPEVEAHDEL